jgi:hypothetical protein
MRAEELYESLLVATQAHKARGSYEDQEKLKADWMKQFVVAFGNDEGEESTTFNGTIPQALMLMNGDLIKKAIDSDKGSFLHTIAVGNLKPAEKVQHLFEAALARKPTSGEITVTNQLLLREGERQYTAKAKKKESSSDPASSALADIFWAVLNSNEFILQH